LAVDFVARVGVAHARTRLWAASPGPVVIADRYSTDAVRH